MRIRESAGQVFAAVLTLLLGLALCHPAGAQSQRRHAQMMQRLQSEHAPPHERSRNSDSEQEANTDAESSSGVEEDADLRDDIVRQLRQVAEGSSEPEALETPEPTVVSELPEPRAARWSNLLPPRARRQLHRQLARGLEELALFPLAARAHEHWIALEPERAAAWYGLARAHVRTGKLGTAEAALREALNRASATADTALSWRLERDLGELYLLQGQSNAAVEALTRSAEMKPDNERVAGLLDRAHHEFDPSAHPTQSARSMKYQPWPAPPSPLRARAILAGAILGLLFLLYSAAAALRGRGDLVVAIDYPGELKGEFSVRLSRQRNPRRRKTPGEESSAPRASSRMEHHAITRETHFRRVRAARYYVSVEGVLRDPDTDAVLTSPYEERNVVVFRGGTAHLEFDLSPRECPVDVRVLWDKRPVKDASVAARGLPQSLRYTRDGDVRLRLPKGTHTICVGSGDRVAERAVVVQSFQPSQMTIDLAGSEDVIFKGCPPAVAPYLHGDLGAAARALELDGHAQLSHLLRARLHHERGQTAQAAKHFEKAGRLIEAAELQMRIKKHAEAAVLFERAGDPVRAAQMHRAGGDPLRAGNCFEEAEQYDDAAECFAIAGDVERQVGALERAGRTYQAADLALTHHDRASAIRLLQLVGQEDANYANACRMLAEAFEHEGHLELAAERLERLIEAGIQDDLPQLHSKLADLFEACDEVEKALSVLTALREIAPTYPNVASRIETLRKRRSQEADRQPANAPAGAPTAFHQQDRYEILEEIGRGGMGVVFKARDTRLERIVALKRLPESLKDHPKAIALFVREAQSAARLNHANIVTVHDTDQDSDGNFFITMELLSGHPLNAILHRRGKLKPREAVRVGIQVATGLGYAHEHRIIHRDIKTANLFFTSNKVVKIMDFGLAKMVEEVRRGTTVIGGTPFYMAPEQGLGGAVDYRADIYAFGVTLYELLTGAVPFPDGDVTYHHRHTIPPDPRTKVPDLPVALVELVAAMMEKKPADRCESAAEVRRALEALV